MAVLRVVVLACIGITAANAADCAYITADTTATTQGVFIPGVTASNHTPTGALVNVSIGMVASGGGAWCANCITVTQGTVAPVAGSFYPVPSGGNAPVGVSVTAGTAAPAAGMACPGGSGTYVATAAAPSPPANNNATNTTAAPKATSSGNDLMYSRSMLSMVSAIVLVLRM